jgi:hypothetical protein
VDVVELAKLLRRSLACHGGNTAAHAKFLFEDLALAEKDEWRALAAVRLVEGEPSVRAALTQENVTAWELSRVLSSSEVEVYDDRAVEVVAETGKIVAAVRALGRLGGGLACATREELRRAVAAAVATSMATAPAPLQFPRVRIKLRSTHPLVVAAGGGGGGGAVAAVPLPVAAAAAAPPPRAPLTLKRTPFSNDNVSPAAGAAPAPPPRPHGRGRPPGTG